MRTRSCARSISGRLISCSPRGAECPAVKIRCTTSSTPSTRSGSSSALGDPVGDMRGRDLLLGPRDSGRHRGLADQERARDLPRRQTADHSQRQRDPRIHRQCGVAAGEDQPQPIVAEFGVIVDRGDDLLRQQIGQCPFGGGASATDVESAVARGCGEPRPGTGRDAALPPHPQGRGVRVLHALLGRPEVGRHSGGRGQHEGPLATMRIRHRGGDLRAGRHCQASTRIGRTSTPPNGAGTSLAIEIASSRSAASMT